MSIKKVVAIIDELSLENVEKRLATHGVTGFSVHSVKGRGVYQNNYSKNSLVEHVQIEVFTSDVHSHKVADLIIQSAHVGAENEGVVAIQPVDDLFWVSKQHATAEDEFYFHDEAVK